MGESIDMFRLLPDSLLSTIVSSLPFEEAVRTSILAKYWKNICKSTTNIEFNQFLFTKDVPPPSIKFRKMVFLDFMKKWIDNRGDNPIDRLSFKITTDEMYSQIIRQFIELAMKKGFKDLELDFTPPSWSEDSFDYDFSRVNDDLPDYVYGYGGLESLKLYSCGFVAGNMVNFHSLKEISFGFLSLKLCDIKSLLINCEMLESLSLFKCNSYDCFGLHEEYLGLKKLVINRCHFQFNIFKINAPNLKIFNYDGLNPLFLFDVPMDKVNHHSFPEHGCEDHLFYLRNFFKCDYAPSVMTICNYLLQVIYTGSREPEYMFYRKNVKHLIMKTTLHKFEFMGIRYMLSSCPNLESLTIEMIDEKYKLVYNPMLKVLPEKIWIDSIKVYKCVESKLKEIKFNGFKGTKNELTLITHFILKGKILRKMTINIFKEDGLNVTARRATLEPLLILPKASTNLEISIN